MAIDPPKFQAGEVVWILRPPEVSSGIELATIKSVIWRDDRFVYLTNSNTHEYEVDEIFYSPVAAAESLGKALIENMKSVIPHDDDLPEWVKRLDVG